MTQRSQIGPFTASAARVLASMLVFSSVVGWSAMALAQATNQTITVSTSGQTSFESLPACNPVGSSRSVQTNTPEDTIGPGGADLNPSSHCGTRLPWHLDLFAHRSSVG